jgi:uncharacterized protein YndB with AHSA1/START domain
VELNVSPPEFAATLSLPPGRLVRGARHGIVRVSQRFRASRERVFDAWLDPTIAGQWLFATALCPMTHVTLDARVGGSFCFVYRQNGEDVARTGKYLEIVRPQRLGFTLALENRLRVTTRVMVEIVKLRTGCELGVTHKDVPPDCTVHVKNRWAGMLYGLGETLRGLPALTAATEVRRA